MRFLRPLLLILVVALSGNLHAQDIHFTLFDMSPLTLNPALSGAFEGTARLGGIYRAQSFDAVNVEQYETPSFYIDAPIIRGFRKQDWIGIGVAFYNDKAGRLGLETSGALLTASYHFALDKNRKNMLTLGLQGGQFNRRINFDNALFADGLLLDIEDGLSPELYGQNPSEDESGMNPSKDAIDFNAGLLFRSNVSESSKLEIGLSFGHVTRPDYNLVIANPDDKNAAKRPFRIVGHAAYAIGLNERWGIRPQIFVQTTTGADPEIGIQGWASYLINPEKEIALNFGLGYRISDAGKVLFGIDYKDFRAALSYDITLTELNEVNNYNGAFEVSAYYILKIYKEPKINQAIFCPKF
ncbi:MAG: PorP/SprF family type IX secretion system membrane protein [Saprospiraceae bacterium]|jgi:type IX secretion system PorP/SprF family membrane protein|nr:PorP/SprF family type IX secretion system membrane protein [Saprospiraceae bacterium]